MLFLTPNDLWGLLALALTFDLLIPRIWPDFRLKPHPVEAFGLLAQFLEKKARRSEDSPALAFLKGFAGCLFVLTIAFVLGWGLQALLTSLPFAPLFLALVATPFLAGQMLADHIAAVARELKHGDLPASRSALSRVVGRDCDELNEDAISRVAIESLSENLSDALIAPLFWLALLGLPGLLAYKALNTLDSLWGYRSPEYRDFGKAAARLDDLANYIPARLTAFLVVLAALFLLGVKAGARALNSAVKEAGKHKSINAGWPEAAFAGALNIALAGPRSYQGVLLAADWIGPSKRPLTFKNIVQALRLFQAVCWLVLVILWAGFWALKLF